MNDDDRRTVGNERPSVPDLASAERWIGIHHHYAVQDAERMNRIEDRLRALERRGLWRRFYQALKRVAPW